MFNLGQEHSLASGMRGLRLMIQIKSMQAIYKYRLPELVITYIGPRVKI